ncbi:MAG: hypothetical protein C0507_14915 [Cyanobacteria bacterium PR.3.49]|nr:hypothetical protein [Cyanobacteria bacterium PR.3.49]
MLAKGQGAETTGAIAVLEGLSRLQDQELTKRFNIEPAPRAVALEYLSLYPNRVQGILRPPGVKAWTTVSKHWPIPDETILSAIAGEEKNLYGLRWGEQTRFAVFDIDNRSKYHKAGELQKLQEELAAVGLRAQPYQSSDSGGWHVYIFLDEWTDSSNLRETLKKWLYGLGYEIRNGTLEIFPSGMGLRLPLQPGFAWLDDSGNVTQRREKLSKDEALASFLNDLEENKRNWSEAKNRITARLDAKRVSQGVSPQAHEKAIGTEGFDELFNYRLIPEKYQDGRQYWQEGLSKNGQRHDAILAVEHYLWNGDNFAGAGGVPALPGEWNDEGRYRLILAWLKEKHNGFCNHINRGNWRKVEAQIRRAVKWRRPSGAFQVRIPYMLTENSIERLIALSKSTGRTWTQEDLRKGNDGRAAQAREKIEAAVQELIDKGRRVTGRQIMRVTGCSYHTVKRHLDIWRISPVVALPRAAGDQNPFLDLIGVGGSAPGPGGSRPGSEAEVLDLSCPGDSRQTDLPGQPSQIPDPAFDVCDDFCSLELAPIVITPPLLLPGSKPTSEHPASSPSPAGCFASLDAGALVRRNSGRGSGAAGGSEQELRASGAGSGSVPVVVAASGLFVISQTYRLSEKHTSIVDVRLFSSQAEHFEVSLRQPTASAPKITSACLQCGVRLFRFSIVTQAPKNGAGIGCRQLLDKHLGILLGLDVRGPPKCRQAQQANLDN